jgi:hypothetical protein
MGVATWLRTIFTAVDPTTYKSTIDGNFAVLERISAPFAPSQASTPNMTVVIRPGTIFNSGVLTEVAQQTTSTITAPVTNPRIDRVVLDLVTGVFSIVTGTPSASPSPPAIPAGVSPCAQILLQTTSSAITNAMITDERALNYSGSSAFPAGTRLAFNQASAPVGWTKDTTAALNDSVMRIVTGSGGGSGGTYALSPGCTVVAAHTHTFTTTSGNNSADHSHSGTTGGEGAAHNHDFPVYNDSAANGAFAGGRTNAAGVSGTVVTTNESLAHTHAFSTGGASAVHTHSVSGTTADSNNSATWVPKYNDFIICSKN